MNESFGWSFLNTLHILLYTNSLNILRNLFCKYIVTQKFNDAYVYFKRKTGALFFIEVVSTHPAYPVSKGRSNMPSKWYPINGKQVMEKKTHLMSESIDISDQAIVTYILMVNKEIFKIFKK